jgi:pimeloyl-ACP methyl ester carboxylesterase
LKSFRESATVMRQMHFTFDRLLILFCVLLTLGVVLWTALAILMAWAMLRPSRMSAGKAIYHLQRLSPGDLGLAFEEQTFIVRDKHNGQKLNIAGWWIPASSATDKCVMLIHGYADAKVGSIAWAPMFHDLSFNILAIDLRAHGDSGGRFSTGGFFERDDVDQVFDQLLNLYPAQTSRMILFGISLGAAVACAVALERQDILAVILESPYTDYEKAVAAQIRLLGVPGGLLLRAAMMTAQWISGATFAAVRPIDLIAKLKCPAMTIVGSEDELLDAADFRLLEAATGPSSVFWLIENAGHLQAMALDPVEYERRIGEFVNQLPK